MATVTINAIKNILYELKTDQKITNKYVNEYYFSSLNYTKYSTILLSMRDVYNVM